MQGLGCQAEAVFSALPGYSAFPLGKEGASVMKQNDLAGSLSLTLGILCIRAILSIIKA